VFFVNLSSILSYLIVKSNENAIFLKECTDQQNNTFCIKRKYDITFLANFLVLIPNFAFIFLWHVKFWSYDERLFRVYKQLYAT